jgi:hypothetical protein
MANHWPLLLLKFTIVQVHAILLCRIASMSDTASARAARNWLHFNIIDLFQIYLDVDWINWDVMYPNNLNE